MARSISVALADAVVSYMGEHQLYCSSKHGDHKRGVCVLPTASDMLSTRVFGKIVRAMSLMGKCSASFFERGIDDELLGVTRGEVR